MVLVATIINATTGAFRALSRRNPMLLLRPARMVSLLGASLLVYSGCDIRSTRSASQSFSTSKATSIIHPDGSSLVFDSKKTGDKEKISIKVKLRPFREIVDVIRQYVSKPIVLGPGVESDMVVEELMVDANSGLALAHEVAETMGFKVVETEQNLVIEEM